MLAPIEGKWPKYRREVREAAAFLALRRASLTGDVAKALPVVQRWAQRDNDRDLPPEPEASRVRSAAAMLKAGTLTTPRGTIPT